jgi:putative DNA primase/helicase
VLVEGEKCADALIRQGIVATTAMNGAKAPVDKTDWTPLAGKAVLIWPDRDAPGWDYAEAAARACVAAGCRSVAILVPPTDKPEKWDAADASVEGFDVAAFIAEGERRVIKAAAPVLPTFSWGRCSMMTRHCRRTSSPLAC